MRRQKNIHLIQQDYAKLKDEEKQAARIMLSQSEELRTGWTLKKIFIAVGESSNSDGKQEN